MGLVCLYCPTRVLTFFALTRDWREKQAAEIQKRDEASRAKRDETVGKAERAIDQFYEEYAAKKEKAIRENKCVFVPIASPHHGF